MKERERDSKKSLRKHIFLKDFWISDWNFILHATVCDVQSTHPLAICRSIAFNNDDDDRRIMLASHHQSVRWSLVVAVVVVIVFFFFLSLLVFCRCRTISLCGCAILLFTRRRKTTERTPCSSTCSNMRICKQFTVMPVNSVLRKLPSDWSAQNEPTSTEEYIVNEIEFNRWRGKPPN